MFFPTSLCISFKNKHCKSLSVKSTDWSRGEIRITRFSFLSSRPCFLTRKQNKINLIFTFKAFGNYFSSVWMSMFSSVDFFGSKYMWFNSQGSVRKALNIVHPPFLQKFQPCMHRSKSQSLQFTERHFKANPFSLASQAWLLDQKLKSLMCKYREIKRKDSCGQFQCW